MFSLAASRCCLIELKSLDCTECIVQLQSAQYLQCAQRIPLLWEPCELLEWFQTARIVPSQQLTTRIVRFWEPCELFERFQTARIVPSQRSTIRIVRWPSTSANLANCSNDFKLQGSCLLGRWRQGSFALALLRTLRIARVNSNCKDRAFSADDDKDRSPPANLANCSNDFKLQGDDDKDRSL